ncbi:hypothetical protein Peur_031915 [Populus x canadensis]
MDHLRGFLSTVLRIISISCMFWVYFISLVISGVADHEYCSDGTLSLASRGILRPPKKGPAVQRSRSRTLTAVHEAMLEDLVMPAEIAGKRIRYRIDGSKIMKVFLDPKEHNSTEYELETFSAVYRKLSG